MVEINNKSSLIQFHKINAKYYQSVWDFQTILHNRIKADKQDISEKHLISSGLKQPLGHLIFCEHAPVYTLGKSADKENLLVGEKELTEKGFEVLPINRGGDITYHGPGQITAYLIMDLETIGRDVHAYVRNLEQTVIDLLHEYGIVGERVKGLTGVWIRTPHGWVKICAIGVHLSRWVSMHGLAFNVSSQLKHFNNIIPCGINDDDKSVTSLVNELGQDIKMIDVETKFKDHFGKVFGFQYVN